MTPFLITFRTVDGSVFQDAENNLLIMQALMFLYNQLPEAVQEMMKSATVDIRQTQQKASISISLSGIYAGSNVTPDEGGNLKTTSVPWQYVARSDFYFGSHNSLLSVVKTINRSVVVALKDLADAHKKDHLRMNRLLTLCGL